MPALLLVLDAVRSVEIDGADGVPFLRHGPGGVFANPATVSFRDNPDFADRAVGSDGWARIGEPGRIRWLDTRLQYFADRPPAALERAAEIAEVARWEIPARVDERGAPLRGAIVWLPREGGGRAPEDGPGLPLPAIAVSGLVVAGGATWLVIARRRSAARGH